MFNFFRNTAFKTAVAFALSLVIILGLQPMTGELAAQNAGSQPSQKHETIFVNFDHSGNMIEMFAVNTFIKPGDSITDYGDFENIINLTNNSVPTITENRIVFEDLAGLRIFRYQATLGAVQLPWNFDISYYLDGEITNAHNLAGASGRLRIVIDSSYNPDAHPYFTENYMVQLRIPLQMDKAFSINAPDASVMYVGNTATVAFTLMPKSARQFSLEADVFDFAMDPIDIAAIKAVVPANEDIDEIESGFEEMAEGTQELIDGTEQLKQGMTELSDGLGELYEGAGGISRGMGGLAGGIDEFSNGLSDMENGLNDIAAGSGGFNQALSAMASAMPQLTGGYENIEDGLDAMLAQRDQLNALAQSLAQSQDPQVRMLAEAMIMKLSGLAELQGGMRKANQGLLAHAAGIGEISAGFETFNRGVEQSAQGAGKLNEGFADIKSAARRLSSAANSLRGGLGEVNENTVTLPEDVGKIVDGQKDLREGILLAKDEILQLTAGGEEAKTVSFVSPIMANAETVQFIMRTPAIEEPQIPEAEQIIEQTESIWDRLITLFRNIADRFM